MKKHSFFKICTLSAALLVTGSAIAKEPKPSYLARFTDKSFQGLSNTAAGFIELPKNIVNISHDQNIFVGLTWGTARGIMQGVSRTVIGVAELITSPIPTSDYMTPPYPWSRFSEDTRYFGAHMPGFWTTYGPLDDGE